eukprot:TRINITY_DN5128_c2_g1_i5.p1 TRINITY_DN5128_c2_g1~~TRINITY_DN5128_c2_g1_i5.p1  ORF type:complete len:230 (-),score=63.81 TRINITY_DN5128_c2_g1_i5:53-742(-)
MLRDTYKCGYSSPRVSHTACAIMLSAEPRLLSGFVPQPIALEDQEMVESEKQVLEEGEEESTGGQGNTKKKRGRKEKGESKSGEARSGRGRKKKEADEKGAEKRGRKKGKREPASASERPSAEELAALEQKYGIGMEDMPTTPDGDKWTYLAMSQYILEHAAIAMTPMELAEVALAKGMLHSFGCTNPANGISTRLSIHMSKLGSKSLFVKSSRSVYTLRANPKPRPNP